MQQPSKPEESHVYHPYPEGQVFGGSAGIQPDINEEFGWLWKGKGRETRKKPESSCCGNRRLGKEVTARDVV